MFIKQISSPLKLAVWFSFTGPDGKCCSELFIAGFASYIFAGLLALLFFALQFMNLLC